MQRNKEEYYNITKNAKPHLNVLNFLNFNVYIGEESEFDNDVTVIKTKYNINGEEGTIAIVGPKRMEYDRVIGLLDYINKNIGGK